MSRDWVLPEESRYPNMRMTRQATKIRERQAIEDLTTATFAPGREPGDASPATPEAELKHRLELPTDRWLPSAELEAFTTAARQHMAILRTR